jgi:hypothetical protein
MTPAQYNEYQRQADVIEEAKKWKEEQENKQLTSIEYLVKEFSKYYAIHQLEDEIEKAKEMHKAEIINAFDSTRIVFADQYYQETYESKGSDGHELDDDIPPTSQYFPTSSQTQHNSPKVENKTSFGEVSDDEIEKQADIIDSGIHRMFFITGAKWYREQLKNK